MLLFALLVIADEAAKRRSPPAPQANDTSTTDPPEPAPEPVPESIPEPAADPTDEDPTPEVDDPAGHIAALLDAADADIRALRLTTPPGDNALEKLGEVLELDPGNADAAEGIETIAQTYVGLGDTALHKDQIPKAVGYYRHSLEVVPHNRAARAGIDHVVERIKALGTREAERGNIPAAERYLRQALELAPNSQELRRIERRLKSIKAKKRKKTSQQD